MPVDIAGQAMGVGGGGSRQTRSGRAISEPTDAATPAAAGDGPKDNHRSLLKAETDGRLDAQVMVVIVSLNEGGVTVGRRDTEL